MAEVRGVEICAQGARPAPLADGLGRALAADEARLARNLTRTSRSAAWWAVRVRALTLQKTKLSPVRSSVATTLIVIRACSNSKRRSMRSSAPDAGSRTRGVSPGRSTSSQPVALNTGIFLSRRTLIYKKALHKALYGEPSLLNKENHLEHGDFDLGADERVPKRSHRVARGEAPMARSSRALRCDTHARDTAPRHSSSTAPEDFGLGAALAQALRELAAGLEEVVERAEPRRGEVHA